VGIEDVIGRISAIQSSIAAAVEEQSATTDEMGRSFARLSGGAQEITDSVAGVATSTRQTTTFAGSTRQAAEDLSDTAGELREIVARFRIS
jgi:methyl-accepting chemotaxis protein